MTIVVDDIDEPEVWALLKWMAERSSDWVLIGGLMVATFDIEYGHDWRQTHEVDSLFDVRRAASGAIRRHVDELREIGFEFVTARQGLGHRMARGNSFSTSSRPITSQPTRSSASLPGWRRSRHREARRPSSDARPFRSHSKATHFRYRGRTCSVRSW